MLAAVIVGVLVLTFAGPSPEVVAFVLALVMAALVYFAYKWIHWSRTVLVITNRRLFQFVSLGIKRVTVMPVIRQSIVFKQSPIGRALGFASVVVKTANGAELFNFNWLGDPERFREEITDLAA